MLAYDRSHIRSVVVHNEDIVNLTTDSHSQGIKRTGVEVELCWWPSWENMQHLLEYLDFLAWFLFQNKEMEGMRSSDSF